jgi:hypothetical protein
VTDALTSVLCVGAALLVAGGLAKVARPQTTANVLHVPPLVVRVGALGEAAIGLVALATGGRLAAGLVAISYTLFAGFVVIALARDLPLATCACFGEADSPPTLLHVALDVALAGGSAAAALNHTGRALVGLGPAAVGEVSVVTYMTFLALTARARLQSAVRDAGR